MAFYQFLCASTVMIILLSGGCHSLQPVCGRAAKNTSSVGGRDAPPESWPWLVSFNSNGRHFCSGSLINNQWVLTSVYCAYGHDTTVYLGRLNQSGPNFVSRVSRGLERTVCDPSYYICLLKLSAPVNFTDYIQPVCLASAGSTFHTGVSSWFPRFGSSSGADILREVKVSIVGKEECKCTYSDIPDNLICAVTRGNTSCQGDSGVPLVTKKGFVWIQSGIVNHGCGSPGYPGRYIRMSQYQDWITNITNNSSEPGFVTYRSSGVDSDLNVTCSTIQPTTATITITPNTTSPWPPINPNLCGRAAKNTSSVGGRDAPPESWPWLVSFNSNGRHFCSGSLINNQWVLTSVYCAFRPYNNTKVYLGRFNQSGPNFNGVSRGLERTVCDPSYNLCLLKLSAPVNFTDYIQPVCLASAGSTFHTGVSSWFAGFGDTQADSSSGADILQEVKLSIVGKKECKCAHPYISDYGICAVTRKGGKDSCQGFSGEPLVTKEGFVWIQSGIVNYGCGRPGYPGVYIRVSQHQDWITNIINNSSEPGFVTYRSSGVDSDLNVTCSITPNTTSPWPPINPNCDNSLFCNGGNVVHFSHFSSLCLLVISLCVLV